MTLTVLVHQRLESVHWGVCVGLVGAGKADGGEVGAVGAVAGDLRAEGGDAEVVAPDLAVVGVREDL